MSASLGPVGFRLGASVVAALLVAASLVTVAVGPAQAQNADEPLTAAFVASTVPSNHGGAGEIFTLRIRFSEDLAVSYVTLRDEALVVGGGVARKFKRVDGSNSLWEIHVEPSSGADVTLTLGPTSNCSADDAVCTSGGKALSHSVAITIAGPATTPPPTLAPPPPQEPPAPPPPQEPPPPPPQEPRTRQKTTPQKPNGTNRVIVPKNEPTITLSFQPDATVRRFEEEVGAVSVGLRAQTAGDVAPTTDFQVAVQAGGERASAEAGSDYQPFSPTYVFRAADFTLQGGRYAHTVTKNLVIIDDDITEKTETFEIRVDAAALPVHVTAPSNVVIEIHDSDTTTLRMVAPESVEEGEDVVVTFILDKPTPFALGPGLASASGTALRGEDFFQDTLGILFPQGAREATKVITTAADRVAEGDETFDLTLVRNGLDQAIILVDTDATVTILDDDHAPVIVTPLSLRATDYTTEVATLVATDDDGDEVVWEITGGADRARFTLTRGGVLSFASAQSYESPGDANRDRRYHLIATVTDGANPVEGRFTVELVPGLVVGDVTRTTAQVTVNVPHASVGETVYLQYGTDEWGPTLQRTASGGAAVFSLRGLDAGSRYTVRASLDPAPLVSEDWLRAKFETRVSLTWGPDAIWAKPTGGGGYELGWAPTNAFQPGSPPGRGGYRIARVHYGAQPDAVFEITDSDATSFTDPGPLAAGGTYYYFIWAINRDGPSYDSASVAVTPRTSEGFAAPPSAPRNLRWDRNSPPGQVRLLWDPPADNTADSYIVVLNRVGDDSPKDSWTPITLGATTATTFTDHLSRDDFPDDGYIYRAYYVHSLSAAGARSWRASKLVPIYAPTCDGCVNAIQPPP